MSTFATRLKELRGVESQASFAARLNLNRVQYAKYESGVNLPSIEILANICRVHAVSADWLLGLERPQSTYSVTGSGNVVAQGAGAKVQIGAAGELPQCLKCPIKRRLAKIERAMAGG